MKLYISFLIIFIFTAGIATAQFPVRIPKIKTSKPTKVQPTQNSAPKVSETNSNPTPPMSTSNRQMVMDDAYTFFDAEPVEEYDAKIRSQTDIGWYLIPKLRILGTFPNGSAFRLKVKKNGTELSDLRCPGIVTKDYMYKDYQCFDKKSAIKETGRLGVEVYFIDGATNGEKLVRTYKIDVRKATRVKGRPADPVPDVSHYYIQRHPEAAVAVAYFKDSNDSRAGYFNLPKTDPSGYYRTLHIYSTYSPPENYVSTTGSTASCTVNGKSIDFANNLNKNNVRINEDQSRREVAIYTDRKAAKYKRGSAYKDQVEFTGLTFQMPIYTGKDNSSLDLVKIEENPGLWECKVMVTGETYRTFRWEVTGNRITPHPEQTGGNANLFYDAAIIDMEIPAGGSPIDFRLMPMPEAGFFYGIPWTSAEGKKMAAEVPKKGNPFHVPSNRAN
jgi:hypothetical protein